MNTQACLAARTLLLTKNWGCIIIIIITIIIINSSKTDLLSDKKLKPLSFQIGLGCLVLIIFKLIRIVRASISV